MKIEVQEIYHLDGKEFRSLKQAQTHVENEIGAIIDSSPLRLNSKDRLAVFEAIVKYRQRLCQLLNYELESDDWQTPGKNILEMDL